MSQADEQAQYMELHLDLEQTRSQVIELKKLLTVSLEPMMRAYVKEDEMREAGTRVPNRTKFDIATRAAVSAILSTVFPILEQLDRSLVASQHACEIRCPALNTPKVAN